MTRSESVEVAGVALLIGGIGLLSIPWALIVCGGLILAASVAGRALKCFRR